MKRLWCALIGMMLIASTLGIASDAPTIASAAANTTAAILLEVDGIPQEILFVSTKGEVAAVPIDACRVTPDCVALGKALVEAKRTYELNLSGGKRI